MSKRNTLDGKFARRIVRSAYKERAEKAIPDLGVRVNRHDVMGQRYLAVKGFPYSQSVASVVLKGDAP